MKLLVFVVAVIAAIDAASIYQKSADIPVQVVYDKPESVRNLEDKPQAEPLVATIVEEEKKPVEPVEKDTEEVLQKEETKVKVAQALKNLDEKQQLSQDEIQNAEKNLPVASDQTDQTVKIVTPDLSAPIVATEEAVIQPSPEISEPNIDDIYDKIQEIILNGAKKIQADFEALPEDAKDKQEVLEKVNSTLEGFLDSTKKLIELKAVQTLKQQTTPSIPNPQNIFQQIMQSFQTFSSNLFSGLNPGNQNDGTTPASGSGPSFPNPIQMAQNAFSQLQNNLSGLFGLRPPNSQSDEQSGQQGANPFQQIGQQIQQTFNNIFRPSSTNAPGSQGDDPTTAAPQNPLGFIQTAFQNVGNIFQPSTAAPGTQSEEATTQGGPLSFFQNAGQNVINAIQNGPFGTSTQNPAQSAVTGAQNAASSAQQAIGQQSGTDSTGNPIAQQGQQIQEQIQQAISSSNVPGAEQIQGAATQIQQAINGQQSGSGSSQPGQQIQEQIQQAASQIQQAINSQQSGSGSSQQGQQIQEQIQQAASQIQQSINNQSGASGSSKDNAEEKPEVPTEIKEDEPKKPVSENEVATQEEEAEAPAKPELEEKKE